MRYNNYDRIIRDYIEDPEYFFDKELYGGLLSLIEEKYTTEDEFRDVLKNFKPVVPEYVGLICLFFPAYGSFMMHQILGNGWRLFAYRLLLFIISGLGLGCIIRQIIMGDQGTLNVSLYILTFVYWSWFFRKQSKIYNVVNLYTDLVIKKGE